MALEEVPVTSIRRNNPDKNGHHRPAHGDGAAFASSKQISDTLPTPDKVQGMLKNTTEMGNVDFMSMSRTKNRPVKSGSPLLPSASSAMSRTASSPSPYPQQTQYIEEDTRSLRHPRSTKRGRLGGHHDSFRSDRERLWPPRPSIEDIRSYSMTQSSYFSHTLTQRNPYTNVSQATKGDVNQARSRSPYAYPTRLKRPSYRPSSPASSDISRSMRSSDIDQKSYRTASPSSMYHVRKEGMSWQRPPNSSEPTLAQPSGVDGPTYEGINAVRNARFDTGGYSTPRLSSRAQYSYDASWDQLPQPSPIFYDYSEQFEEHTRVEQTTVSSLHRSHAPHVNAGRNDQPTESDSPEVSFIADLPSDRFRPRPSVALADNHRWSPNTQSIYTSSDYPYPQQGPTSSSEVLSPALDELGHNEFGLGLKSSGIVSPKPTVPSELAAPEIEVPTFEPAATQKEVQSENEKIDDPHLSEATSNARPSVSSHGSGNQLDNQVPPPTDNEASLCGPDLQSTSSQNESGRSIVLSEPDEDNLGSPTRPTTPASIPKSEEDSTLLLERTRLTLDGLDEPSLGEDSSKLDMPANAAEDNEVESHRCEEFPSPRAKSPTIKAATISSDHNSIKDCEDSSGDYELTQALRDTFCHPKDADQAHKENVKASQTQTASVDGNSEETSSEIQSSLLEDVSASIRKSHRKVSIFPGSMHISLSAVAGPELNHDTDSLGFIQPHDSLIDEVADPENGGPREKRDFAANDDQCNVSITSLDRLSNRDIQASENGALQSRTEQDKESRILADACESEDGTFKMSRPDSRPWNLDSSYPWEDDAPKLEVVLPQPVEEPPKSPDKVPRFKLRIHRASSSTRGTGKLSRTLGSSEDTVPAAHDTSTHESILEESTRSLVTVPQRGFPGKANSSHDIGLSNPHQTRLVDSFHHPSLRTSPAITLLPPSPGHDVRSFFSDDSSQLQTRVKGSFRKRFSDFKAARHSRQDSTGSNRDRQGYDRGLLNSAFGMSRASGRSSRQSQNASVRASLRSDGGRRKPWYVLKKLQRSVSRRKDRFCAWKMRKGSRKMTRDGLPIRLYEGV